jgi:hypothetical protein
MRGERSSVPAVCDMSVLGWVVVVVLFVWTVINGFYMVVSPRAWFRLRGWLGLHGTLSKEEYAEGWGALQVRYHPAMSWWLGSCGSSTTCSRRGSSAR